MTAGVHSRDLDLLRPIYAQTSAYGHFGRELPDLTWERTDRADLLKRRPRRLTHPPGPVHDVGRPVRTPRRVPSFR